MSGPGAPKPLNRRCDTWHLSAKQVWQRYQQALDKAREELGDLNDENTEEHIAMTAKVGALERFEKASHLEYLGATGQGELHDNYYDLVGCDNSDLEALKYSLEVTSVDRRTTAPASYVASACPTIGK
jgi:hypothetical protein